MSCPALDREIRSPKSEIRILVLCMNSAFHMTKLAVAALLLASLVSGSAITPAEAERYTRERVWIYDAISPATADLRAELDFEITRLLDLYDAGGHVEPAFFEIGITGSWILFGYPGEQAYVLAEALPFLPAATQTRLKNYLAAEVRAYDPTQLAFEHCSGTWGNCEMTGNRREFFALPTSPNPDPLRPNIWPPPAVPPDGLYMLWRYCENTGDWAFLSAATPPSGAVWTRAVALFNSITNAPTRYGEVAGAIGFARMLEHFGMTNDALFASALAKVQTGLTAGTNYSQFVDASYARFINGTHDWAWTPFHFLRQDNAVGTLFAPEIGRFLREHALDAVQRRTTRNPDEALTNQAPAIESHWAGWYLTRGEYPPIRLWVGHYGENHMTTPDTPWALFMTHAWVYEESPAQLRQRLDAPYCIGDLCHIQRLTATLAAHGTKLWSAGNAPPPTNNVAPQAALVSPTNNAAFGAPANLLLAASATDEDGYVSQVQFFSGTTLLGTVFTPPHTFAWNAVGAGSYTLTVRALDNWGAAATSAPVNVTVTNIPDTTPPSVPQNFTATALSTSQIALAWSASTDNVAVASYELERDAALLPASPTGTSFTDSGLAPGSTHTYRIRAVDLSGNRSEWSTSASATTPLALISNLLVNGGFESGTLSGWSDGGGIVVTNAAKFAGNFGAAMAGNGRIDQTFSTVAGQTYYVAARVRINAQTTSPGWWGGLRVQITDYGWTELAVSPTLTTNNTPVGVWRRLTFSFTAMSTTTRLIWQNFSGGLQINCDADNFVVSPTPIPDDTPPSRLTGAALLPDGRFRFTVEGLASQGYTVLASPDLSGWLPVFTNTTPVFAFTNAATNTPARFFRAQQNP
jgi:hypothetical protein